jgi:hypothetical protein
MNQQGYIPNHLKSQNHANSLEYQGNIIITKSFLTLDTSAGVAHQYVGAASHPHPSLPNVSLNLLLLRATGCKVEGSRGVRLVVEVAVDLLLAVVRVARSEVAYSTVIFCHNSLKKYTCPMRRLKPLTKLNSWFFTSSSVWPPFRVTVVGSRKAMPR